MVSHSPHLQRPVYYLCFQVFGKSHAAEGGGGRGEGGGARLCNTLYTKQAYLRRLKLSKLKNVCLSKISQWWNDNAFLSKVFMAFLNKDSILSKYEEETYLFSLWQGSFTYFFFICYKVSSADEFDNEI